MKLILSYFFSFKGRIGRRQYLLMFLMWQVMIVVFFVTLKQSSDKILRDAHDEGIDPRSALNIYERIELQSFALEDVTFLINASMVFFLVQIIGLCSICVRRLNDIQKTFWIFLPPTLLVLLVYTGLYISFRGNDDFLYYAKNLPLLRATVATVGLHAFFFLSLLFIYPSKSEKRARHDS